MGKDICEFQQAGRALITYEEAVAALASEVRALARPTEGLGLSWAEQRVLAEPVALDRAEPPVPRSAMDGYALRAADGRAPRNVVATFYAGTAGDRRLAAGEAVAVMTGGTVPSGADAVVPVEQVRRDGDVLHLDVDPESGRHVRRAGEMGDAGRRVVEPGRRLGAAELAVLAGCGHDPVEVRPRPRVVLLSTGDEVVRWTRPPRPHQVRDSNRLASRLQLLRMGAEDVADDHVADDPQALRVALEDALAHADLVVTIGGVSMGDKDHLPRLLPELGVERLFHGVRLQPGKPVWVGQRDQRWVLALPGNPVSSFVVLELLGRVLLSRLEGENRKFPLPLATGTAGGAARTRARPRWMPARLDANADGSARVTPCQEAGSGDWTSLAGVDALLHLPMGAEVESGDPVHYLPL